MSRIEDIAKKLSSFALPKMDYEKYFKSLETDNEKLKLMSEFVDEIEYALNNKDEIKGDTTPFGKLHDRFRFREGEVTLWTGFNGHKKSMMLGYVILHLLGQQRKCCVASFEMKPVATIFRMVRQFCGYSEFFDEEVVNLINYAQGNFYLFDHMGGITPERLYGVIHYAATKHGVKHFVVDSLMRVVAGEDKYNEQKDFVVKLCDLAIQTNCHIHLVHHVKKGDENKPAGRYDAKGSGAISDNVHNSLNVWSNKNGVEGMPQVILTCDKQRSGSWEGRLPLTFCAESLRFSEEFSMKEVQEDGRYEKAA
jgi:twinkle protein